MPRWVILVALFFTAGVVSTFVVVSNPAVYSWLFISDSPMYQTPDEALSAQYERQPSVYPGWNGLLPDNDKMLTKKYGVRKTAPLQDQIFASIQASMDSEYQQAMVSAETVSTWENQPVTMNGYIVPLEFNDARGLTRFFLVPYFGACIHFPPPPPNQIIYVRLAGSVADININQAYSVSGILQTGLFEDPQGTSAYILDAVTISRFTGQPDDVRQHN